MKKPIIHILTDDRDYVTLKFKKSSIPEVGKESPKYQKMTTVNGSEFFSFENNTTLEIGADFIRHITKSPIEQTIKTLSADGILNIETTSSREGTRRDKLYHPNSPVLDELDDISRFTRLKWAELNARSIQDMVFAVYETNSDIPAQLKRFTEFSVPKPASMNHKSPELS